MKLKNYAKYFGIKQPKDSMYVYNVWIFFKEFYSTNIFNTDIYLDV